MAAVTPGQSKIIRTERGLSVDGTRITLYDVMDYVKANHTPAEIMEMLPLNAEQVDTALRYIREHEAEVEQEYQDILRSAEEIRRYWEERNREHFARIAAQPRSPEKAELWAKLQAWKAKLQQP